MSVSLDPLISTNKVFYGAFYRVCIGYSIRNSTQSIYRKEVYKVFFMSSRVFRKVYTGYIGYIRYDITWGSVYEILEGI